METKYIGKVIDDHIFLICEDENGTKIQCPHVELFTQNGYSAIACPEGSIPKAPYKFLTKEEVALFFNGMDAKGNIVEKPSEWHARIDKWHKEKMATDEEYRKEWAEFMAEKERMRREQA